MMAAGVAAGLIFSLSVVMVLMASRCRMVVAGRFSHSVMVSMTFVRLLHGGSVIITAQRQRRIGSNALQRQGQHQQPGNQSREFHGMEV